MAGYWGHPDWTVAAWRNLWLHTGDMLMRDEEGNLYFVDRTKDAIRRRGENISSMEVEQEIVAHPDIVECAVIPVASEHTEQEVMAVVVPRPGATLEPAELIEFLARGWRTSWCRAMSKSWKRCRRPGPERSGNTRCAIAGSTRGRGIGRRPGSGCAAESHRIGKLRHRVPGKRGRSPEA